MAKRKQIVRPVSSRHDIPITSFALRNAITTATPEQAALALDIARSNWGMFVDRSYAEICEDDYMDNVYSTALAADGDKRGPIFEIATLEWARLSADATYRANPLADIIDKGKWHVVSRDELARHPEILSEVLGLVQTAYAPIGGHLKITSEDELAAEIDGYDLIDLDDDPYADAAILSKYRSGTKHVAIGHDGEKASKIASIVHNYNLLREPGNYSEVSGRFAKIMLASGVPIVTDEQIVRDVLGKPIQWIGNINGQDGWYQRKIGSYVETKIMVGRPLVTNPDRSGAT